MWNYRVVRSATLPDDENLQIIETWYDATGKPNGTGMTLNIGCFETVEEIRQALQRMLSALDKPILNIEELC